MVVGGMGSVSDGSTKDLELSNRSGIGARVQVFWNEKVQVQEVSGGSGYAAQNQRRLHFGLGSDGVVEKVEIRWPSGVVQTLDAPEVNRVHRVEESR